MSNSLAACELLGERRSNYSSHQQKTFHHHHITDSLSPVPSALAGCPLAMPPLSTGGGGGLQLAAAAQNKRKEKARIAARARRSQEASIIMEMAAELEITQEKLRRIDKATIVKLAIDYMRAFEVLCCCQRPAASSTITRLVLAPPMPARQRLAALSYATTTTMSNNKIDNDDSTTTTTTTTATSIKLESKTTRKQRQQELFEADEETTRSTLHDEDEYDQDEQENQQQHHQQDEEAEEREEFRKPPLFSAPKLATTSIFAPKTLDNMNSHFLMIEEKDNGKAAFVLRPDTEILDDDDLTHLAPQAGDISISLEADPLDGIPSDDLLMLSPKSSLQTISVFFNCTKAA